MNMGMNDKPIKPKREISPFFYENKLYEFSQKKLSSDDRAEMKKMIENDHDSKYGIGGVLLSLEYLQKLSEVNLEVKEVEYEKLGRRGKWSHLLNFAFFTILTGIFSLSGYYILLYFNLGLLK